MSRKQAFHKQFLLLARYRSERLTELPQPPPPQHEPIPKRNPDRPPNTIPQPIVPHPGSDPSPPNSAPEPGPAPITMRGGLLRAMRQQRAGIVTSYDIKRVSRPVPLRAANFGLRYRNLSFKRKLNVELTF